MKLQNYYSRKFMFQKVFNNFLCKKLFLTNKSRTSGTSASQNNVDERCKEFSKLIAMHEVSLSWVNFFY